MVKVNNLFSVLTLLNLGLCATAGLTCASLYYNVPLNSIFLISFGLITLGIYALNRWTDDEDMLNNPDVWAFSRKYNWSLITAIVCLSFSVIALKLMNKFTFAHLIIITTGAAYSIKMIPVLSGKGKIEFIRLKDLTFVKELAVAITFGAGFFGVLWAAYPEFVKDASIAILLMICGALVLFMNTNYCDIRDVTGDKAAGVPTIAAKFGIKNTLLFAILVPSIVWVSITTIFYLSGAISFPLFVFFLLNSLYPGVYIAADKFKILKSGPLTILIDSSIMFYALGLVVLKIAS